MAARGKLATQKSLAEVTRLFQLGANDEDAEAADPAAAPSPAASPVSPRLPSRDGSQHSSGQAPLAMRSKSMKRANSLGIGLRRQHSSRSADPEPADERPPRETVPHEGRLHLELTRRCAEAMEVLTRLQQPRFSETGAWLSPLLQPVGLRFAQGLAFFAHRKVGVLGGVSWGQGAVIARLPDGCWSPPCFMVLRRCSLGITFGTHKVECCHVFQSTEQVAAFVRGHGTCGLDAAVSADADPFDPEAPAGGVTLLLHPSGLVPGHAKKPSCALISDGGVWDLSLCVGYVKPDSSLNRAVYGAAARPDDILAGRVPLPAELQPLLDAIDVDAAGAQMTLPTRSKFEEAREKAAAAAQLQHAASSSDAVAHTPTTNVILQLRADMHKTCRELEERNGATWRSLDAPPTPLYSLAGDTSSGGGTLRSSASGATTLSMPASPNTTLEGPGARKRGGTAALAAAARAVSRGRAIARSSDGSAPGGGGSGHAGSLFGGSVGASGGSALSSSVATCATDSVLGSSAGEGGGGGLFGGGDGLKLFGDVTIGFRERHTYDQQALEEAVEEERRAAAALVPPGAA